MENSLDTPAPRGSRLGKNRRRVLIVLLVLAIVIAAVPWLLTTAALRPMVLARVVPPELGSVAVEKLSLGWLSGIDVQGVVLIDTSGQKVLEAERLTVSRSLLNLALDRRDLGTIRIDKPTLYIVTRADGSNVEDLLATAIDLVDAGEDATTSSPQYVLRLADGQAYVADPELGEMWRIENLQVDINHPSNGPLEVAASGQVGALDPKTLAAVGPRGGAKLVLTRRPDGEQHAELTCDNLPLAAARPWMRRWDRDVAISGIASGKGEAKWHGPADQPIALANAEGNSIGRFDVTNFRYAGSAVGNRPLDLPQVRLPWNLELARGQLTAKQLAITTDAGSASATGIMPLIEWNDPSRLLSGIRGTVEGDVNLARLTQLAPDLIPLREGAAITGGSVNFRVTAEPDADALRVLANLETTALAGERAGRIINWDAPLRIRLAARQFDKRLMVESANVQSEFAQFALTGDRKQMRVEGSFDLDKLADRLGEFVDLSDMQMAGTGKISGAMQLDGAGQFTAGGAGSFNNLVVMQGDRAVATEPLVEWQVNCQGKYDAERHLPSGFDSGQLTLIAGTDELVADLNASTVLADSISATAWPVKLRLVGDLNNWQRRLRPFLAFDDWQLAGRLEVSGTGKFRATPFRLALTESKLGIDRLAAQSENWNVQEPRVEWTGDLEVDSTLGTLASRNGQLVGSALAASLRNWLWTLDRTAAAQAGGELAIRADLARLSAWQRTKPTDTSRLVAQGQLVGNVNLTAAGDELRSQLDVRGDNVSLVRVPLSGLNQPVAPKPMQVALTGGVTYRPTSDELILSNLHGQSDLLGITAQGKLAQMRTRPVAELVGTIDYDLAQLTALFVEPAVGPDVKFVGREQATIRMNGPLPTAQVQIIPVSATGNSLTAHVAAPWESASLFGLPIGGGKLEAQLASNTVEIQPFDFAVGGGRLTAAPRMLLSPSPAVMTLPAGPLLTDVTITPEVSNRLLKYVNPLLDQATQTEGKFSIRLDGATIPVAEPRKASLAGQMAVKSVRVGPGPRIQPFIRMATEIEALSKGRDPASLVDQRATNTAILVRDRTVDFRMVDGRVYHQGLEFQIRNLVIRSSGSVGLDETLDLVFDIPLEILNGQSAQIPVHGTFSNMDIDMRAFLRSVAGGAVQGQLHGPLQGEINNALNRLFGR